MHAKTGLTADELDRLLAWFHPDRREAGEQYEIMRLKLIEWFEHHGCSSADEFADVVLDRVAKRLAEGELIRSRKFFQGVARMVFLESVSRPGVLPVSDELELRDSDNPEQLLEDAQAAAAERRDVLCMIRCLRELPPEDRRLICEYHRADARGKRARIARRIGLSAAGLYSRVHRLRKSLAARLEDLRRSSDVP